MDRARPPEVKPGAVAEDGRVPPLPLFRAELLPGDILYIPSDHLHHCENRSGTSLHLSIAFKPLAA
jgi:oxalate decarboxylase/phosphoglucose isomerase-like protein (cupin superfamily)